MRVKLTTLELFQKRYLSDNSKWNEIETYLIDNCISLEECEELKRYWDELPFEKEVSPTEQLKAAEEVKLAASYYNRQG